MSSRRQWLLAALGLALAGCGQGRRSGILVPRVSLAGMEQRPGGWRARVRVQNVTDKALTLARLELELQIDRHRLTLDLANQRQALPPYATDVYAIDSSASADLAADLARLAARPGGAAYRLQGTVHSIDPERRFAAEFEGFLSPVPGRDGAYR